MRNSIIIAIAFLLLSSTYINAQEYDEFYLSFEAAKPMIGDKHIVAWANINDEKITVDPDYIGHILPVYDTNIKNTAKIIGKVVPMETGELEIQLENTPENLALLENNKSLIKIDAKLNGIDRGNIIYDIYRLGIGMLDIHREKDFTKWILSENIYSSKESYILESLVEESAFVAKEMRKQMDSPEIKEGRFEGLDLFEAMEAADENDVKSFLRYVRSYPFKYQGTDWIFSETFATWIAEGAPTTIDDLKDLASSFLSGEDYFIKYFKDVNIETTKEVLEYLRGETGAAVDNENLEYANGLAENTLILSKEINDPYEIAWSEYKMAKVLTESENHEEAISLYENALVYFNKEKLKSGILVAGNDAADNYNKLGGKSNYKKAISLLEESIKIAVSFGKEDKTISPVTALMYRNIGKSYQGLEKHKKALEYYETGLEYTTISTPIALKRKATLELYISEAYEKMGKSSLAEKYSNKAVTTYLEYEAALAAIKNL